MSVRLQLQFVGGARAIVDLHYDHFAHHIEGRWNSASAFIGRPNGPGLQASGTFEMLGGILSMYENGERGRALAAELRYYPKLGGMSSSDIESRNFEEPFRIYRAAINNPNNTGTWHILDELWDGDEPSGNASKECASTSEP